jgi:hypothetical protein
LTNESRTALGIPTFEDKVAQRAVTMVLEAIYEQAFLPCYPQAAVLALKVRNGSNPAAAVAVSRYRCSGWYRSFFGLVGLLRSRPSLSLG